MQGQRRNRASTFSLSHLLMSHNTISCPYTVLSKTHFLIFRRNTRHPSLSSSTACCWLAEGSRQAVGRIAVFSSPSQHCKPIAYYLYKDGRTEKDPHRVRPGSQASGSLQPSCSGKAYKKDKDRIKVVASVWGAELIKFLAALAVLQRTIWINWMNCTRKIWNKRMNSSYSSKSSLGKIASAARNLINFAPPNSSDDLCLFFCMYPSSMRWGINIKTKLSKR